MRLYSNAFGLGLMFVAVGAVAHAEEFKADSEFYRNYFAVSSVETHAISTEELPQQTSVNSTDKNASPYEIANMQPGLNGPIGNAIGGALGNAIAGQTGQDLVGLGTNLLGSASTGGALSIVQTALQVWDIIQDNKAVANVDMASASALPVAANANWQSITGWKPERSIRFSTQIKNLYGMTVVDLTYDVRVLSGGSLRGKGLYIASARVLPTNVKVLWGYSLDVKVNVAQTYNARTEANPLAAIELDVQYTYGSILRKDSNTTSYLVRGDGLIKDMTGNKVYIAGTTNVAAKAPQLP